MRGPTKVLQSYAKLVAHFSGAASVSLFVPAEAQGQREILVHHGESPAVPELADGKSAREFDQGFNFDAEGVADEPTYAVRLPSQASDGVLFCIPLRWALGELDQPGPAVGRRRKDAPLSMRPAVWIGLRFAGSEPAALGAAKLGRFPMEAETQWGEGWWSRILGVAAAFAVHARMVTGIVTDPITDLPGRAELQAELDFLVARARAIQSGATMALLFVNPNDFAAVNDRFDRRVGDQVLAEVAQSLRESLRGSDHVARYGGAIFSVILMDTVLEDTRVVADKLLRRLSDHAYHGGAVHLSFSIGVALADAGREEELQWPELVRRADQALSAAKRGGGGFQVWSRMMDVAHVANVDRLQGIFTGNMARDYRNMMLLWDSVAAVAASTVPAELARGLTEVLFEAFRPQRIALFEEADVGRFELLAGLERTGTGAVAFDVQGQDLAIVARACRERRTVLEGGDPGARPEAMSRWAVPLCLEGRSLGCLFLEGRPAALTYEGSSRFLDGLASQMAVALDRARLAERERLRQRAERERLETELADLRQILKGSRLTYRSAAMESVLAAARKVAATDATALITGESGTGKELLARTLHGLSSRRDRPLVVVDCGAISPSLIESELFGHERGAFTGAHARAVGRLAEADGATVFLDEIGDLPLEVQSKLLRFVQEKQLTPVGSTRTRTVDVRIIAATNVDLRARVAEGRFREDLFHRLDVVQLYIPPLRERTEDILHLAKLFLEQFAALYRKPCPRFTPHAEEALQLYAWPGNVRELQNRIMQTVLFCEGTELGATDVLGLPEAAAPAARQAPAPDPGTATPPPAGAVEGQRDTVLTADPAPRLQAALKREVEAATAQGRTPVPIGKWLLEDLVLAADRISGGVGRRGAELLGIAETTYRRQLQKASSRRSSGLRVRSPSWDDAAEAIEDLVRSHQPGQDLCAWAEASLLSEILALVADNKKLAAGLMGVTEPTLLRRIAQHRVGA